MRLIHLGGPAGLDEACLDKARIELVLHDQGQAWTLHLRVSELEPDLVLVSDAEFARTDSLARPQEEH